jgi:hypothetical protein
MAQHMSYKGTAIAIEYEDDDHITATVGERVVKLTRHEGEVRVWGCPEAYFMSDDPVSVIRHLVDYAYIFNSPDFAPSEGHGHGERPPGGVVSAHPMAGAPDDDRHDDAAEGNEGKKRGGGRTRRR